MPFTLGLYDLFAYIIPGFLYLYILYEILIKAGLVNIDILNFLSSAGTFGIILIALGAFLVGHIFDDISHWFVMRLFRNQSWVKKGLEMVRQDENTRLHHKFEAKDWGVLFSIIQQHNPQYFHTLNVFESNSIMLANISLGLFVLAILQIVNLIESFTGFGLSILVSELLLFYLARQRSHKFHMWFYIGTFEASLAYGRSLEEVVEFHQGGKLVKKQGTRNV
jgi:hypothetical protein